MKKILSILICVFFGLTSAWADYDVKVYGYALGEGISESGDQYGGGKITIQAYSAKGNGSWDKNPKETFTGVGTETKNYATARTKKSGGIFGFGAYETGIKVVLSATPDPGFYCAGFVEGNSMNAQFLSSNEQKPGYNESETSKTYSAVFRRYIATPFQSAILVWDGVNNSVESSNASITATVYGSQPGDKLSLEFFDDTNDANDLDPSLFKAYDNGIETNQVLLTSANTFDFSVGYVGQNKEIDELIGKHVSLKLKAKDNLDEKVLKIKITECPSLTFKGTGGLGTYSTSLFSEQQFNTASAGSHPVPIKDNNLLKNISLQLLSDESNDKIFYGWRVENEEQNTDYIISFQESITSDFIGGDVISAVFIPNTIGYMIMHDDGYHKDAILGGLLGDEKSGWIYDMKLSYQYVYSDLQEALQKAAELYASTGENRFVVLENLATLFSKIGVTRTLKTPHDGKEGELPYREEGYIIPKGVTLSIPGTSAYEYLIKQPDGRLYKEASSVTPANTYFRKLNVADNTKIKVNYGANISVFSYVYTYQQSWGGMPINHGWIALGRNSVIELGDPTNNTSASDGKAGLYALGYVTNSEMTDNVHNEQWGRVLAYAGAEVYEILQYTNWRGGSVGLEMISGSVFPLPQYYFQNIEAPLTLFSGAEEYVCAPVDVGTVVVAQGKFIGASNTFFCLGDGAKVTKYYDKTNDRQRYIINSATGNKARIELDNLAVDVSVASMESKNYTMPIAPNIDIEARNVEMHMFYDLCILAGANLYIHDDAVLYVAEKGNKSASIFLYDKDKATYNNEKGYMGAASTYLQPLFYTPNGSHTTHGVTMYYKDKPANDLSDTKYKRTFANLNDATFDVNGKIIIGTSYSSTAGLYTTDGGANIISSGKKGIVKFNSIGTKETTKQRAAGGGEFDIPVNQAVLTNDDGEQVNTIASAGIVYRNVDGKWITTDWNAEDIRVTMPTDIKESQVSYSVDEDVRESIHGTKFTATIEGIGFCFVVNGNEVTSTELTYDKEKDIEIVVRYKAQDTHGVTNNATIKFTNKTHTGISYSTSIKATEDYTPIFRVSPEEIVFSDSYVTSAKITKRTPDFSLLSEDGNVTSLEKNGTFAGRLNMQIVSKTEEDAPFTFDYKVGENILSDATLSFIPPATPGDHEATFVVKMTYTDKNGEIAESEEVSFVAKGKTIDFAPNTLALTDECIEALMNMCVNVPVEIEFKDRTTNANDLEINFTDNGDLDTPILTLRGTGTPQDPFVVIANTMPTTMPTILVMQNPDLNSGIGKAELSYDTKIQQCNPTVQWHWSDLYFGDTYGETYNTPPVTTNSTGAYTLRLVSVTKQDGSSVTPNSVIIYDSELKQAEIVSNLSGEYVATFAFEQEPGDSHSSYSEEFTTHIYAKPNRLSLCISDERIFKAVNYAHVGDVEYNVTKNLVDFSDDTEWTITFNGLPDMLTIIPSVSTQLTIDQRSENGPFGIVPPFNEQVLAGQEYTVELLPSTKYIKFNVTNATSLNICISEFDRVRLSPNILYLPISKDPENEPTTRTVTATYVNRSGKPLNVISSDAKIVVNPNTLEPTADGEYRIVNITVSSIATSEFDASLSVEHTVGGHAQVDVETYTFPQKLPIQLERSKDESKRFHFVTTAYNYKNTEWDAAQYAVKMQNITTAEDNQPYVTFAFDGAPSFISFMPIGTTNQVDWTIAESEDGRSWGTPSNPIDEDGVLKKTLNYSTRYVRVTYVAKKSEVVQMTKINILSDQSAIPDPEQLALSEENSYDSYEKDLTVGADLNLTVVNLTNLSIDIDNPHFTISYGLDPGDHFELNEESEGLDDVFGADVVNSIPFKVFWDASQATDFGNITFTTEVDGTAKTLATVPLVGTKAGLTEKEIIYTGVKTGYTLDGKFEGIYGLNDEVEKSTEHRKVDLSSTYDQSGKPLFDYLIIYGETTTTDGTTTITTPTTTAGSNAKTPVYIYVNDGTGYTFAMIEENANVANKIVSVLPVTKDKDLRVYITGFCPYATTGYTKEDEGVWYFQGENGAKLHVYLDDCYIYSRHKTPEGRAFSGRYDGQAFSEPYVRGSGGVLVFENQDNDQGNSFEVTIHTRRNNMFKSNYGCFFELMQGMRAYNVSSPIQVHLASDKHKANSKTTLTFDDKWPTDALDYSKIERTNGYLSLQKQVNNAPSIDLGNANTIVNFMGGRVELQNAAVVSANYKTTLAISFRSGLMAGFPMAYGIGTDDIGGQVNFYDGTTTVIPMYVDAKFKDFYLLDKDAAGNYITDNTGTKYLTSCLRCPTNTKVYGGSHTMMRACEDVTSKGGAPTDENGKPLGLYIYPKTKTGTPRGGFSDPNAIGLVTPTDVPAGYNVESVTPETNNTQDMSDDYLNFWFTTEEESSVVPEVDKVINFWKACMTEISAEYMSYGGTVGGKTMMLANQEVKNFLYCQIDENIHNVIYAGSGFGEDRVYSYQAPVKDPTGQLDVPYLTIPPSYVGEEWQNYVETVDYIDQEHPENNMDTGDDYEITEKIYYIIPATADIWMTFTAPFNVEKLWVVETYEESKLAETPLKKDEFGNELSQRQSVLIEQAKHNADFAAFFGVAMALGRDQTFEEIHRDYEGWAAYVDKKSGTRGKKEIEHYNGKNFMTANYYLYHNAGEWTRNGDKFDTQWKVVGEVAEGGTLMLQGQTYSMLFPYCTGCDVLKDENGNIIKDANGLPTLTANRDYWDYWSGKFLIFESTQATSNNPHTIKGSGHHVDLFAPATSGDGSAAVLTGNSTFALMTSYNDVDAKVYTYSAEMGRENFKNNTRQVGTQTRYQTVQPTVSFLIADIPPSKAGMSARNVMRSGEIIYDKENTSTDVNQGGHIPTVGGGNDLFITDIVGGVNIAVAEPQQVRVMSATGAIIYSGMVQTAVDVTLPTTGVYVITGENEVHKILH